MSYFFFASGDILALRTNSGIPSLEAMYMCERNLLLKRINIILPLVMTEICPWLSLIVPPQYHSGHYFVLQKDFHSTSVTGFDEMYTLASGSASKFLDHPSHLNNLLVTDSWENNTVLRFVTPSNTPFQV